MAFDEVIFGELALLNALLTNAALRWRTAANLARTSAYTVDALFEDVRAQFVENWDTWNQMMDLPGGSVLPTATIRASWNQLNGEVGTARVKQRLENATYEKTPLTRFGGGATQILPAQYAVDDSGDFEGFVRVRMLANLPAATDVGVYRGMVLGKVPSLTVAQPLAWVVVVAAP